MPLFDLRALGMEETHVSQARDKAYLFRVDGLAYAAFTHNRIEVKLLVAISNPVHVVLGAVDETECIGLRVHQDELDRLSCLCGFAEEIAWVGAVWRCLFERESELFPERFQDVLTQRNGIDVSVLHVHDRIGQMLDEAAEQVHVRIAHQVPCQSLVILHDVVSDAVNRG